MAAEARYGQQRNVKSTTPPVLSGKNEGVAGWKANVEMWSDAAIEKGATAKDIMGYLDGHRFGSPRQLV